MNSDNYREKRSHSSDLIPFSYYDSQIPDYFPSVPLHCHKEFELNRITSGKGEFTVGDDKLTAAAGDIIIIPPDIIHGVYRIGDNILKYDTVVFSSDIFTGGISDRTALEYTIPIINHTLRLPSKISQEHPMYSQITAYADNAVKAAVSNNALNDMILRGNLLCLFAEILRFSDIRQAAVNAVNYSRLVKPSIEYINKHFSERITIQQLADISHLSSSYFMKAFRHCAGTGAIEYVNQIRIKAVCEILRSKRTCIADAAFDCGFTNLSNFNRQFRKHTGLSPIEYSKRFYTDKTE